MISWLFPSIYAETRITPPLPVATTGTIGTDGTELTALTTSAVVDPTTNKATAANAATFTLLADAINTTPLVNNAVAPVAADAPDATPWAICADKCPGAV